MEVQPAIGLFKDKKTICPDCQRNLRLHRLAFAFLSGTVVAPIASCELSRFEIP
jgi:hypothetical protein